MTTSRLVLTGWLALVAAACSTPATEQTETTTPVPVTVTAARIDTLASTVGATGTVTPAPGAEWTIVAPAPARIGEMPKAEGDPVREGDLLVRFDIPSLPAEVAARQADVAQATTRVATAKAAVARLTGLMAQGVASQREVDEAGQAQAEAEAALAQAQTAVKAATVLADREVVRARFDGVVAQRWHNPGDLVDASAGDPILRVIDPRRLQVVAAVPVGDVARVEPGQHAEVTGPADAEPQAAVVRTRAAAVDPASATGQVRLGFVKPTRLPAGAVVQVEITTESRAGVVVVPADAIQREGEQTFVMVAGPDHVAHRKVVQLGLASRDLVQVVSGVAAGDLVVVRGQDGLPDGAAVVVSK